MNLIPSDQWPPFNQPPQAFKGRVTTVAFDEDRSDAAYVTVFLYHEEMIIIVPFTGENIPAVGSYVTVRVL